MKRIYLFICCVLLMGTGLLYIFLSTSRYEEVLERMLKSDENKILDTTEEKNEHLPYQIINGNLYYEKEDGFYRYNYEKEEEKRLWNDFLGDYKIIGEKVYYTKINHNGVDNIWNVVCKDLSNSYEKQVIKGVHDYTFAGDDIYFTRNRDEEIHVYRYDTIAEKENKVFFYPEWNQEGERTAGELLFVINKYFVFDGNMNEYLLLYNSESNEWNSCFNITLSDNLYFRILHRQVINDYLYIQGNVCDKTKSDIAGPYVVEDADENGIWRVNIRTGEQQQLTNTVYSGGIYVLDNILYGINNFSLEKITGNEN